MSADALPSALAAKSNDMMAAVYVAALVRSVLALHALIDNKEGRAWAEKAAADKAAAKAAKDKAAAGKDGKDKDKEGKEGEAAGDAKADKK